MTLGLSTAPGIFVGTLPCISTGPSLGRIPCRVMAGTCLGTAVGMDLSASIFLGRDHGMEGDTSPELAAGIFLGRGPDTGAGTPPQPWMSMALGPSEGMEELHMTVCTAAH